MFFVSGIVFTSLSWFVGVDCDPGPLMVQPDISNFLGRDCGRHGKEFPDQHHEKWFIIQRSCWIMAEYLETSVTQDEEFCT